MSIKLPSNYRVSCTIYGRSLWYASTGEVEKTPDFAIETIVKPTLATFTLSGGK